MRYLILFAVMVGLILLVRWRKRRLLTAVEKDPRSPLRSIPTVRCAHCHLVLPEKEAIRLHGEAFCCLEHAQRHQRQYPQ